MMGDSSDVFGIQLATSLVLWSLIAAVCWLEWRRDKH